MMRTFLLPFLALIMVVACTTEDDITVTTSDLSTSIDENPSQGQLVGQVSGTASVGFVVYSIAGQNPPGAMIIDPTTGELTVLDPCAFDFEVNPTVTAQVIVAAGSSSQVSNVTVTVNDTPEGNIWTGATIVFTKDDSANPTAEANQDRITDQVWIARGNSRGIYNANSESGYVGNVSPAGTEWAFGTTSDLCSLTFESWEEVHGGAPQSTINQDMVLHLISEDIYIDIKFLSWTCCGDGGGFSYQRSTM